MTLKALREALAELKVPEDTPVYVRGPGIDYTEVAVAFPELTHEVTGWAGGAILEEPRPLIVTIS